MLGKVNDSMFTIKGIHAYGSGPDALTNIVIHNNTVRNINNSLKTMITGQTIVNDDICTLFDGGNAYDGNMFDVIAGPEDITINSFDVNLDDNYDPQICYVYYKAGTYVGFETDAGAWNLLGSHLVVTSAGDYTPTPLPIGGLTIPAGERYGLYVTTEAAGRMFYTNGDNVWSNGDLTIEAGVGKVYPFGSTFYSRMWNGCIYYEYASGGEEIVIATTYGGADGIMIQGYLNDVMVDNNTVYDIHSAGWAYGAEVTPTATRASFGDGSFATTTFINEDFSGTFPPAGWSASSPEPHQDSIDYYIPASWITPVCDFDWVYCYSGDYIRTDTYDTTTVSDLWLEFKSYIYDFYGIYYPYSCYVRINGNDVTPWSNPITSDKGPATYLIDVTAYRSANTQVEFEITGNPNYGIWDWFIDDIVLYGEETGGPGPGGKPAPQNVDIECNYFAKVNDGSEWDVWDDPMAAPYPGVQLTIDETYPGADDGDAKNVTVHCNFFDPGNVEPTFAIINKDTDGILDAKFNFYGRPNGPNGGIADPYTGRIADGYGSHIIDGFGPVHFDPWIGTKASIIKPVGPITIEAGVPVHFSAEGSKAYCFEVCCNPQEQELQYLWDFGDGRYSSNMRQTHVYENPGTYTVTLMIDTKGFTWWPNFMYDWDYIEIEVIEPDQPLNANADGGSLGGYEVTVGEPIELQGKATGGTEPYYYNWEFGDGESTQSSRDGNAIHIYTTPGIYTATLTVVDYGGGLSTDTAEVTVYDIDELVVNIDATSNIAQGDSITFKSIVSGGKTPYSYFWNFDDGVVSTYKQPTHVYEISGTYTVTLTVTDANNEEVTKTKTITVIPSGDTSEVEITDVKAGLLISANIETGDLPVDWEIRLEGAILLGGESSGIAPANAKVPIKLPFTIGFGQVEITITAGTTQKQYNAFMIGPFVLNLQEA
jgi:PKD repeat protein